MFHVVRTSFGRLPTGLAVDRYTLGSPRGMQLSILTYGCTVTALTAPDSAGRHANVILKYDTLEDYAAGHAYVGALIGRCANRIADGRFELNGRQFQLARNDGGNSLHGGLRGFDKAIWTVEDIHQFDAGCSLRLGYVSPAGDEQYPGTLQVSATYSLTTDEKLRIDIVANCDEDTLVNLTQHLYFNLRGHGDVLGHLLRINAVSFTPIDAAGVPTGEIRSVAGTAFDFGRPIAVGARIDDAEEQLRMGHGYDHNWIIDKPAGHLGVHAVLTDPGSGRTVEIASTAPGIQAYSGNFLDQGAPTGARSSPLSHRGGLALEPQYFPDAPHHPNFPSVVLERGRTYRHTIEYRFFAEGADTHA